MNLASDFAAAPRRGVLLVPLFCLLLSGCAAYKLGPTNGMHAGAKSIAIKPFLNKTHEPRVSEYVAMSLRRELQVDGSYRLATSGSPDLVVTGEIVNFRRSSLAYSPTDILTPEEYTLTMTAHIIARESATGRTTFDRQVYGQTYLRVGNDLASAEREAIPILADDLARNAINQLTDGSW